MRKIVAVVSLTLDGVMQAPGGPDEDAGDGFPYAGWALPYRDSVTTVFMGRGMIQPGPLLFGRRTYEHLRAAWAGRTDNPFSAVLDSSRKYVASRTLREPLPWRNSALLSGEAAETVARLKEQPGEDIAVLGSGALLQTLTRHGLVDSYVLPIHPIVLGRGRRLFADGGPRVALRLADSVTTTAGVVIATYHPDRGQATEGR